jgi:hypothetical protein
LGELKLHPGLVDLSEDVHVFVLVHGGFSDFVEDDAMLFSQLFDLVLQFDILVVDVLECIFGLEYGYIQLFFYFSL